MMAAPCFHITELIMNPFLHDTVARPLPNTEPFSADDDTAVAHPPIPAAHTGQTRRKPAQSSGGASHLQWRVKSRKRRASSMRRGSKLIGAAVGMLIGAPQTAAALDVNAATLEQLVAVRGIGPRTAQIIIDERRRAGPFESLEDLSDRIRGIGARKAAALRASGLRVGRRYMLAPESPGAREGGTRAD
jgi:competence protein ComEA